MLAFEGAVKRFGDLTAVDDLTLTVRRGEVFGFLGPNGAGKSTSIALATGALGPDAGTVRVADHKPTDPAVRRGIGVAPQQLALYAEFTARENLRFFGRMYGLSGTRLAERVEEVLRRVQLSDRADDRAGVYSGGMQRRLNLAIALVHDPELLLLDEPTVGVDPQSRNAIFELIEELRAEGRTILYTTHYMEEAQRLCDRICVIDHGRLLALGTLDELLTKHGGQSRIVIERAAGAESHLSDAPERELPVLLAQGDVQTVKIERASLESVFLNLTGRSLRDA